MLIDGKKDYLEFAENEIRKLYFLVKKKLKRKAYDRKRKSIDLPSAKVKCEECPKTVTSDKQLMVHMKSCHTEMERPVNKKKKVITEDTDTPETDVTMIDLTEDLHEIVNQKGEETVIRRALERYINFSK